MFSNSFSQNYVWKLKTIIWTFLPFFGAMEIFLGFVDLKQKCAIRKQLNSLTADNLSPHTNTTSPNYNKEDRSNRSLIHKISFRPKLKNTALLPYLLAVLDCVQSWSHFPWSKFAFVNFFLSWRRFWFSSYCYKFNKTNQLSPVLSPFLCSNCVLNG